VEQLLSPVALDQLRVAWERTDEALTTLLQGLEQRRGALAGGTDGEALGPGLRRLVRGFPLILGLAAAALVLAAARRRRELGHLVRLLAAEGSSPALRPWLSGLERWSPSTGPETRGAGRRLLALTLGVLAWIGVAAVQLLRPGIVPAAEVAVLAGGGALAVLLAAGYSLAVVRGLRRLPDSSAPPVPEKVEDEAPGEDVLDVHQLKR